jgi:hypothetical protein
MSDPNLGREPRVTPEDVPETLILAAFNTDCPESSLELLGDTLGKYLDIDDVTVGTTLVDDQPAEFAVLHDDVLIDGALVHPGRDADQTGLVSTFDPADTLFLAGDDDRSDLRALSNRVEKLAWRAGRGRLYVGGQQRLATMDDQWDLYAAIAAEGAEVHVFEDPDFVPVDAPEFVVHGESHSLAGTWLVAYDGDGNDAAKAAMVAVEREPDSYYGIWTVVPELVDVIIDRTTEIATIER